MMIITFQYSIITHGYTLDIHQVAIVSVIEVEECANINRDQFLKLLFTDIQQNSCFRMF